MNNDTVMTMPVAPAYSGGGGGFGGGMWGDGWWGIILFLAILNGGWGGFGGGWGGGMNGGVGSEVQRGFDHTTVVSKLDGITQGICDSTYALNNTMVNGFHGVDSAICNLGYQTQSGFNALSTQLAQCCCDTQRSIDAVRYDMARESCDTRHAIADSTRQILDFLTTDKINTLTAENQSLKFQASQSAQNGFIDAVVNSAVAQLRPPTPIPSYSVPNPNCCYPSGYGYGYNGCGCGG